MPFLNLPWVESPFFEEVLAQQKNLSKEEIEQARFYSKNGYLVLKNAVPNENVNEARQVLETDLNHHFSKDNPRALNLWKQSKVLKHLACLPNVLMLLEKLYGREVIPFQTLNFSAGSQQNPHSDTIHFNSFPEKFMAAAWIALEDMDEENGTVVYYPGSHKLKTYDYTDLSPEYSPSQSLDDNFYVNTYEPFIQELMKTQGIEPKILTIKKGDVLIWSANLVHGGLSVKDATRTRWSQVVHFYFKDCLYYTPQLSNRASGEWFLRKIENIRTGEKTWGSYNGQAMRRKLARNFTYLISKNASYNMKDFLFLFSRLYYRVFKK